MQCRFKGQTGLKGDLVIIAEHLLIRSWIFSRTWCWLHQVSVIRIPAIMVQLTDVSCNKTVPGTESTGSVVARPGLHLVLSRTAYSGRRPSFLSLICETGVFGNLNHQLWFEDEWGDPTKSSVTPQATRRLLLLLPCSLVTPPPPFPHHSALWSLAQPSCPDCGPQTDRAACLQITDILVTVPSQRLGADRKPTTAF